MLQYPHIKQLPFCCVPACIQMVLKRRGLEVVPQEEIGYSLGLTIPPILRSRFPRALVSQKGDYGSQLGLPRHTLTDFFKKEKLPLREEYFSTAHFDSEVEFLQFFRINANNGNDMLISFDTAFVYPGTKNCCHASLVAGVEDKDVHIINPSSLRLPQQIHCGNLVKGMCRVNGGIWLVSSI